MGAGGWFIYGLSYLLYYPKFVCTGDIDPDNYHDRCKPEYFCDESHGVHYTIDWDDEYSLNNWMKKYEMYCASSFVISLFGMCYFLGLAVGSTIFPY